jgi:hypothetical protein
MITKNGIAAGNVVKESKRKTLAMMEIPARILPVHHLRRQNQVDSMIKRIIAALIIAHVITAAYITVWWLPGNVATIKANFFVDRSAMPGGMELAWYYKYMAEYLLHCITYSCMAVLALKYSRKLFFVVAVFNIYHYLDFIMFLVNFAQSAWVYAVFAVLIAGAVVLLLWPIKEKGRVVSLE